MQPVLALDGFLSDSAPAKEAANLEDKSRAWRVSPGAKLSLYHLQAVCHWVISKPLSLCFQTLIPTEVLFVALIPSINTAIRMPVTPCGA